MEDIRIFVYILWSWWREWLWVLDRRSSDRQKPFKRRNKERKKQTNKQTNK